MVYEFDVELVDGIFFPDNVKVRRRLRIDGSA